MPRINKARYWWAVLYPENMIEGWQDSIGDLLQVPYAYCVHDTDTDSKSEHRKDHVHLILAFANTTTYKHAMETFSLLGEKAVNTCQAILGIRHAYDYLIHDTESCKKQGKYLYDRECRHLGNGFDIGAYEQISAAEKLEYKLELADFFFDNEVGNFADMFLVIRQQFTDSIYFEVFSTNSSFFDRLAKGIYHRNIAQNRSARGSQTHENCCPDCGSNEIKKKGKTAAGQQRYVCKCCGKSWI